MKSEQLNETTIQPKIQALVMDIPGKSEYAELAPIQTPSPDQIADLVSQLKIARSRYITDRPLQEISILIDSHLDTQKDELLNNIEAKDSAINQERRAKGEILTQALVMLGQSDIVKLVLSTNDYPYEDTKYRGQTADNIPQPQIQPGSRVIVTTEETPFTPRIYANLAEITKPNPAQVISLIEQLRNVRIITKEPAPNVNYLSDDLANELIGKYNATNKQEEDIRETKDAVLTQVLSMLGQAKIAEKIPFTNGYAIIDKP
jgi:hypothetical protein